MRDAPTRKLAVLPHADVAGSTALVRLNELLALGPLEDAGAMLSRSIGMPPKLVTGYRQLTATHLESGDPEAARRTATDVPRPLPDCRMSRPGFSHGQARSPHERKRRIGLPSPAGLPE